MTLTHRLHAVGDEYVKPGCGDRGTVRGGLAQVEAGAAPAVMTASVEHDRQRHDRERVQALVHDASAA